jgi:large subunit ribosomal protein L10
VPLNKADKQAVVAEVNSVLTHAQTMVLTEYRGVAVGELTQLRYKARTQKVVLRVLKNTLARRAVENTSFAPLADQMTGSLIYSISEDPVAAAKVVHDFAKNNDKFVIRAGINDGKLMNSLSIQALASIPSREELLSQLLGVMLAPVSGFARALAALSAKQSEPQLA